MAIKAPKKILFVVDSCCFPIRDGSSERYAAWLSYLKRYRHDIYLLSFNSPKKKWTPQALAEAKKYTENILIIDSYAGRVNLILSLCAQYWNLFFNNLTFLPNTFWNYLQKKNHNRISHYIKDNRISTIIINKITCIVLMGFPSFTKNNTFNIIDIHDIHADHYHAIQKIFNNTSFCDYINGPYSGFLIKKLLWTIKPFDHEAIANIELSTISLFDKILVTSLPEENRLKSLKVSSHKITYLSPVFSIDSNSQWKGVKPAYDFGFIGSRSLLNIQALVFFKDRILPVLKKSKKSFKCLIAGSVCDAARKIFQKQDLFHYIKYVENIEDFYNQVNAVFIPLQSGSGISIKTLEAMGFGCPVISTTIGARGLNLRPDDEIIIEDDPVNFGYQMLRLLKSQSLRERISNNAKIAIDTRYSLEVYHKHLKYFL